MSNPGRLSGKMDEERVAALFGQGLFPTLSNAGIGAVSALALAPAVGRGSALTWWSIMAVVTAARAALWAVQRARPGALSARAWLLAFTVGGTANGLTWGAMALVTWPPDAPHRALIGFIIGGMVASSTAVVPAYLPAFYTFAAAAIVPLAVRFFLAGSTVDLTMGFFCITFGLAMGKLARRAGAWFGQNTELRLHNAELVAHLEAARAQLEQRVKERTAELEQTVALLREAEARAQAALRDRDDFLAVASHELRTPIATLELHVSRLAWEHEKRGSSAPASLPLMHRQLRRLTGLVDTVLTASGPGAVRPPPLTRDETDLPAVVRTVVGDLTVHASSVPEIHLDLQEPVRGAWDAARLEQVVSNLVSNALKYGAGTPVDIRLAAPRDDEPGDVVLTVADHGPGILPADQAHVFDRFFRADVGVDTGSGLGLGLAVVRELVEAMGGAVSVASAPGEGATFTVRLPRGPGESVTAG